MAEVELLVEGFLQIDFEKRTVKIASSSTLVKDKKCILVDCPAHLPTSITPNIIILTHSHLDHTWNVRLFRNRKLYFPSPLPNSVMFVEKEPTLRKTIELIDDELKLSNNVIIFSTPGHVRDHISVLVHAQDGNYVIAGDAIKNEAELKNDPLFCWNIEKWRESRKKILSIADYVVLGHGGIVKI